MKKFFVFVALMTTSFFANAAVILQCQLSEDDVVAATVSEVQGIYTLTETSKRGAQTVTEISVESVENQRYRLSDGRNGFRYLSMMYSDFFNEFNWFVESRGGFSYTISRAYCK